jgi:hypothetical protein
VEHITPQCRYGDRLPFNAPFAFLRYKPDLSGQGHKVFLKIKIYAPIKIFQLRLGWNHGDENMRIALVFLFIRF